MKFLVVSGNPKKDGLTRKMTDAILRGARDGGTEAEEISVCGMGACRCCNGGARNCLSEQKCVFGGDGFSDAQERFARRTRWRSSRLSTGRK